MIRTNYQYGDTDTFKKGLFEILKSLIYVFFGTLISNSLAHFELKIFTVLMDSLMFIVAAELRVLYKPELAEMVSKETMSGPVSVQQTVDLLSHILEILECDVFGFLGVDQSEVVILIKPITPQPSMLQVNPVL